MICRYFAFLGLGLLLGGALSAEPYRMVAGDVVRIAHQGLPEARVMQIDADGNVRLAGLGGVALAGETLDAGQDVLGSALQDAGILVDRRVTLSIEQHAPVVVGGHVATPGRYEYIAGLTIDAAVGLAGGTSDAGLTAGEVARSRADTQAGLRAVELETAAELARIARLLAQVEGAAGGLVLNEDLRARLPLGVEAASAAFLAREGDILEATTARRGQLLQFWATELEEIERQRQLFDAQISVQKEIARTARNALDVARDLKSRGLQTNASLGAAAQRDSDARARLLDLESAKIGASRALSDARQARARFLADERTQTLDALQAAMLAVEMQEVRAARLKQQLRFLQWNRGPFEDFSLRYVLVSPRPERQNLGALDGTSQILPGESVIVRLEPQGLAALTD